MAPRIGPSTRNAALALGFLGVCVFSAASQRSWQGAVRASAQGLAMPPQRVLVGAQVAAQRFLDRVAELWGATAEVERLREENRALKEALARLSADAHDAGELLRSFQGFEEFRRALPAEPIGLVSARVVGADASPWRSSVVVDRGSTDGVRVGTPAAWGSSVVGIVVAVRRSAATVRLLDDPLAGLKVRVARTGDVGVLRGAGARDGLLQLKWLHLRPVQAGDLVVTSGLDPAIPPGLVAGRVVRAPQTKEHLFYDVRVRPLVDLQRVSDVLLVIYRAPDVEELLKEETK